ncbi:MAG TPA: twin-arginine translocase TatA/TatE family subunit [Desulfobacterales bacterium]|nr:twin-arginine translocase TatA/TatE family subunit [Desulfobacterales bacterium]
MFELGTPELLLIVLLAVLFFGGEKLPELGQGLGKSIRFFKKGLKEDAVLDVEKDESV